MVEHFPVLLQEVISCLTPENGDVIFDATLGGAGHAAHILEKISPAGMLIGVDKDEEAIERAGERLRDFEGRVILIKGDFRDVDGILEASHVESIDGAVFDLGVSSFQLDEARRGFSFLKDGPLDMRLNAHQKLSARAVVNKFSREELFEIIGEYGEEKHARLLAGEICRARRKKEIKTTGELVGIIQKAIGSKYTRQRIHPACRTFQALRIYVNDELSAVKEAISKTVCYLRPGGRICVISFHSLEDRIAKNVFRDLSKKGELCIITKKPVTPQQAEIRSNPRSRSAKLRVAERVYESV